jgi:hypothetical protein
MCVVRTTQDHKHSLLNDTGTIRFFATICCDTRVVYSGKRATMRKYLLAFFVMMAVTIIAAEPMQLA